jgi:starch phosphorylase
MDRYVPLPPLPARIRRLNELAYDLWWSWNQGAREVFRELDYPLWRFTDHNPVLALHLVEPERLEFSAADPEFLRLYDAAVAALDAVRSGTGTWWAQRGSGGGPCAWITPQFALHQSLPVHATSQGVVWGDAVKEASDLGLPFIGIGFMYARAYPHQRLTADGWQQESVEYLDWSDAPINPASCPDGTPCTFGLEIGGAVVAVTVWQVRAGRARIYLLDTDLPENAPWNRDLASRCCDDDPEAWLRQSVLLGAGSVAALEKLEIEPAEWHIGGAQASSVILERLHRLVGQGLSLHEASACVRATTTFRARVDTASASESVSFAALDRHLATTWRALEPHRDAVFALARHDTDRGAMFNGAVLAARRSSTVRVAEEGVHLASWISADLSALIETYAGPAWRQLQEDDAPWRALLNVPDEEIWAVRQRLRGYLVAFVRERARRRWAREQASGNRLVALGTLLDEATLTIGCAPRFGLTGAATLFADADRLAHIATAARRPVQFLFAGRVQTGDNAGKHRLQQTFRQTLDPAFGGRLAFLEDYDLHVGRLMVQGCDVWLTLPPHAGGPSLGAVKAAVNGVPHAGAAEAWGAEPPPAAADWAVPDARTLYSLIEERIVPAFYERHRAQVPERWTALVRETLADALPRFSARKALTASTGIGSL